MTWTMANYTARHAMFRSGANAIMLSKGETEAGESLDYVRFIHSQLPSFLQLSKGHDQASLIDFPAMHSKIRALPATRDAGIGLGGASLVIPDEFEFHEYAAENYAEIKPMIDTGNGQMVIMSAPNKYDQETKFKGLWLGARDGMGALREITTGCWVQDGIGPNNFYPIFLGYNVLPERDEAWYEERTKEYDQWEIEGRYPRTEQEALSAPQLVCRFDVKALEDLKTRCSSPLKEEYNGLIKIYQEPIAGGKYCFVMDSSEGTASSDPCAGMIIDHWCEKVAEFHGRIPLDEQARIGWDLYQRYYNPFTAVERNAAGLTLIEKLKDLGITNWFFSDKARTKEGWWTSSGNRPPMLTDLAEAVFHRQIKEPNPEALDEFHNFIRTKKKQEGEARKGAHDEYVIMWAIFLQIRKVMPTGTAKMITAKYKVSRYR